MPVFKDLITLTYAKTIANIDQAVATFDVRLGALITACSVAAASYCGRQFVPSYFNELYNGSGVGFLVLRASPTVELVEVVIGPSTDNPLTYDSGDLDIDAAISRIAFKPSTVSNFFSDFATSFAFPNGINSVQATYYGGYGAIVTVAASIATGSHAVTPSSMYGRSVNGDLWAIDVGSIVSLDSGLATEEAVQVTAVTGTTFTATFTRAHAAGSRALVAAIPADLQSAVGLMVSNLHRQKDLSKSGEHLGQYSYTLRANERGAAFTPEVLAILNRYKSAFSG